MLLRGTLVYPLSACLLASLCRLGRKPVRTRIRNSPLAAPVVLIDSPHRS
jgi:hypothetical protein